ncbi:calcium homeostasis endoplasmic reticulum protein isoform X1 [Trichogramma pretiosum]|uniref:calcium homeostasis endoplasmic reticulum protein isoform X1 n=1 Tax=Trichogramma pretiosum TaxID=7493 RepID=UPI0006C98ACE|nr:calcium homeostasis endoplasmic reticulum protein isoform X1 [Trichogramma pretiosum]
MDQAPADIELRNIIDKLAQFVARNGPEFEHMTKNKQKDNPKFSFLFGGEYFNYYQYKVTTEQAILKQKGMNTMSNSDPRSNAMHQSSVAPSMNNVGMPHNNGLSNPMPPSLMVQGPPPNMPPPPNISAPLGHMPPQNSRPYGALQTELATLQTQQSTLQDQVRQSEQNLAAHHAALMSQQQGKVEEAVRQAQDNALQTVAQSTNTDLQAFDTVLQPIIDSCTKDSISAGKAWILQHSTTLPSNQVIAKHLLKRVIQETTFNHKLHIIYLVNDVLHHCARKKSMDLRKAMESVVVPMFCNASLAATEEQVTKLNKLLSLWESKSNYFEEGIIEKLKNPTASWTEYQSNVMSQHASAITSITATTKQTYDNYQAQHQAFVNHAMRQIQTIEQQKMAIDKQLKAPQAAMNPSSVPPAHTMPPLSGPPPNAGSMPASGPPPQMQQAPAPPRISHHSDLPPHERLSHSDRPPHDTDQRFGGPPLHDTDQRFGGPPPHDKDGRFGGPPQHDKDVGYGGRPPHDEDGPGRYGGPPAHDKEGSSRFGPPPHEKERTSRFGPPLIDNDGRYGGPMHENEDRYRDSMPRDNDGRYGGPPRENEGRYGGPPHESEGRYGGPPPHDNEGRFNDGPPSRYGGPPGSDHGRPPYRDGDRHYSGPPPPHDERRHHFLGGHEQGRPPPLFGPPQHDIDGAPMYGGGHPHHDGGRPPHMDGGRPPFMDSECPPPLFGGPPSHEHSRPPFHEGPPNDGRPPFGGPHDGRPPFSGMPPRDGDGHYGGPPHPLHDGGRPKFGGPPHHGGHHGGPPHASPPPFGMDSDYPSHRDSSHVPHPSYGGPHGPPIRGEQSDDDFGPPHGPPHGPPMGGHNQGDGFNQSASWNAPPPSQHGQLLPDFSKPPPGFGPPPTMGGGGPPVVPPQNQPPPLMAQEIKLEELMPTMPYFDLPAGLMVPLVKLEDHNYKSLDPDAIRLPPPAPPSDRLIAAVEQFYAPPNHDSPRDSDGWEKLALYEYYRAKNNAKKRKEEDIEDGIREKSRSPTPITRPRSKSPSPPKKRYRSNSRTRSRSRSRSRGRSRSRTPPTVGRDNSSSSNHRRSGSSRSSRRRRRNNKSGSDSTTPRGDRNDRSPTPPSFLGSTYSNPSQQMGLDESNKGHQLLRKMGWGGAGLGANEQGIEAPISGGDIRDRSDQYKGVGINLNDPYENFRKSKGQAFITRMKARAEERAEERGDRE